MFKKLHSLVISLSAWDMSEKPLITHTRNNDDVEFIEALIRKGYTPNICDSLGRTPLIFSAGNGNPNSVSILLSNGADATRIDTWGNSALHYAAESRNSHHPLFAKKYYSNEKGGGSEVPKEADYESCIIHISEKIGNGINLQNSTGDTALMNAVGYTGHLSALLSFSPDLTLRNRKGDTALDIAKHYDMKDSIKLLSKAQERDKPNCLLNQKEEKEMGRAITKTMPVIKLGKEELGLFLSYDDDHGTIELQVSDTHSYIFENAREWDDFYSLVSEFHTLLHNKRDVPTI